MKEKSVLKSSPDTKSVWWHLLAVSQGGNQGLDPSHLYSCERSLFAPVIPLTLLGARIPPASGAWHPASCRSLSALVELPALSLAFLPKMSRSSGAFVTPTAKPGYAEFLFLAKHPSRMAFPWDGHTRASCGAGTCAFPILLRWREG